MRFRFFHVWCAQLAMFWCCIAVAQPRQSEADEFVRIANEGQIARDWTAVSGSRFPAPEFPAELVSRGIVACVGLGYRINADGTTSDFRQVVSWQPDNVLQGQEMNLLAEASATAVSNWNFVPRSRHTQPTYTVATMVFRGRADAADVRGIAEHCRVADLRAVIGGQKEVLLQRTKGVSGRSIDLIAAGTFQPGSERRFNLDARQLVQ